MAQPISIVVVVVVVIVIVIVVVLLLIIIIIIIMIMIMMMIMLFVGCPGLWPSPFQYPQSWGNYELILNYVKISF